MKKYHIDEKKVRYNTLSNIFLCIISVLAIAFLFLTFYPFEVVKPNIQPYKVLSKQVEAGGRLTYVVDACKYMDVSATVSRSFKNLKTKIIYPALVGVNNISKGCDKTKVSVDVPIYLPMGDYIMFLDISYKINVFSDKQYHFETEAFSVKEIH